MDPTAPFDANLPETLTISSLNGTIGNGDFVAIKVGDVNLSAGTAIIRGSIKPFELSVEDKVLKKNTTYTIPIKLSPFQKDYKGQNVSALQFALNVDKNAVLLDNIGKGDLPNCSENNIGLFKNEGTITAAWSRSPSQRFVENDSFTLLNLTIKATKNARLSEILSLNPIFTEGVAYDEIGNGAPIKLSFGNGKTEMAKATLLPNRPNPFSEQTTIAFILPESGVAKLTITDLLGRVVSTTEKAFVKGLNEVVFNASDTPSVSSGVLVVRLQTGNQVLEQKILLSR